MSVKPFNKRKFLIIGTLALVLLVLAGCSSNNPPPATNTPGDTQSTGTIVIPAGRPVGPFPSTYIDDVQVGADAVTFPVKTIVDNTNIRFQLPLPGGADVFMAYVWDGKVNVRASVCPPCRSTIFTLSKGKLVCNTCGSIFDAATGKGISGACMAYGKQPAQYQRVGDDLIVSRASLLAAYNKTLNAGR